MLVKLTGSIAGPRFKGKGIGDEVEVDSKTGARMCAKGLAEPVATQQVETAARTPRGRRQRKDLLG
jgi:hypothetical protein